MNTSPRRTDLNAAGLYVLLAFLFYLPQLYGLRTFPDGDFTHHFLPFSLFQQRELLAGRLPLWNPYTYSGHPFLADTQAAVFYPLSNILIGISLIFRTFASEAGVRLYFLQLEAALHVALAGFFVYLLVLDLTGRRLAAFLAGCTFAFSGYLTGYPPLQLAVLRTAIWLPLILWLLLRAFHAPMQWRWWIGAGVAYAIAFLAGHPQTFLHISYTVVAWWVLLCVQTWRTSRREEQADQKAGKREWRALLIGTCAFGLVAAGLSAAQALPSIEFMRLSVRANTSYEFVSGGFPLQDTWQLLLPGVLTQFPPLYVGVIGLGLAVCALGLVGKPYRVSSSEYQVSGVKCQVSGGESSVTSPQSPVSTNSLLSNPYSLLLFFLSLTLIALLLSYGGNGFLYPLFYRVAPGWDLFRGQERVAYLVALGLSVLAGYGLAAPTVIPLARRRLLAAIFSIVVIAGVYAFGLLWQLNGRAAIGQWTYLGIALLTLSLAMTLAVLLWWEGWSQRRSLLLIGLTLLNLFGANVATNIAPFGPARKTILAPEMEALEAAVTEGGDAATGLPGRVYNEFRIYDDYGMRQQIEDVWGSSPLRLARYAALFDEFPLARMWRLTGVEHVLSWRRDLTAPSDLLAEFPQATDTTFLHRLREPNPRAWIVSQVQTVTDDEAPVFLVDPTFDVETMALLPPDAVHDSALIEASAEPGDHTVQIERIVPNRLHIAVESASGGLLIISENWMPGWRVREAECAVRGAQFGVQDSGCERLRVVRANLTFIGVPVPPGVVEFDLVYWPHSVFYGLVISGVTVILLALVSAVRLGRRRRS